MQWLASLFANGLFKAFGDMIVQPLLTAYLKSKDVDLEKFKVASADTTTLAVAVLDANVKFAQIKANYALAVLNWWPFRVILFALLFFPSMHFITIVLDSNCPVSWGWHIVNGVSRGGCGWGVPAIPESVFPIYQQLLLFFVIAKPVDSAVTGGMSALNTYLQNRR